MSSYMSITDLQKTPMRIWCDSLDCQSDNHSVELLHSLVILTNSAMKFFKQRNIKSVGQKGGKKD